jgi:rhomboid family GlyGly-CTERM serine protease
LHARRGGVARRASVPCHPAFRPALREVAIALSLSPAERFALTGALLLVVLQLAAPWHAVLEYRAEVVGLQPWRLLTAHFVHVNWTHLVINAAAWFVVARLYAPELPPRSQLLLITLSSLAISVALAWLHPGIVWYRGFSGVLHALFFAGGTRWLLDVLRDPAERNLRGLWLPLLLLVGGAIKVLLEQPAGSSTPYADWLGAGTVPQAHLAGAAVGLAVGLARGLTAKPSSGLMLGAHPGATDATPHPPPSRDGRPQ